MSKVVIFLFSIGALLILAACKEDSDTLPEATQSVDWYKAHQTEHHDVLVKCRANPGTIGMTPNCVNASRANSAMIWGAKGSGMKRIAPLTADEIKN